MSDVSSSAAEWFTRLDPVALGERDSSPPRDDDPRLGEVIETWQGGTPSLRRGRAVLIGFPQDEGVRRNGGRPGSADAPREIRRWLSRLVPWECENGTDLTRRPPLDLGDVRLAGSLEETQAALGEVIAAVLKSGAVPIVLGGGHETAYGHYLGYVGAGLPVGVVNVDAHLDVRPFPEGRGHSGSPFRQMFEHPTHPLPGDRYSCLGVQPHATARAHWDYCNQQGCAVHTADEVRDSLTEYFLGAVDHWSDKRLSVMLTLDADVVSASDVPGVSAPNVSGLSGDELLELAREAGSLSEVKSLEIVEINPHFDRDGQSARWAALVVWNFLIGLAGRGPGTSLPLLQ